MFGLIFSSTYYLFYYFIHPQRHIYSLIILSFFVAEKPNALSQLIILYSLNHYSG